MHRVLLPWEHYVNVTRGKVKSQMGDLYPRWVGARELLLHGKNPYGEEVSHEIQIAFYGHPITQSYDQPASEIVDEQRFVYPVYVVFLLAPAVHTDFDKLQRWAPLLLGALVAASVWLWMGVLRWKPTFLLTTAIVLFVVSSPQIAQGLRLRQFGLLVAFLLALAVWCVVRGRHFLAGVLLAIATIKPQMVSLCLIWFLIWSVGGWRKKWPLSAGFCISLGALTAAGAWLVPGWPKYFFEGLEAYRKYFPTTSILRLILGNWIGGGLSLALVGGLLIYAWSKRRIGADSPEFLQVLAWFFVATTLLMPLLTPYNQVLLLLPILMLIREWSIASRWERFVFAALVSWPTLVSFVLLVHSPETQSINRTPLLPSTLLLLFPFFSAWFLFRRRVLSSPLAVSP